MPKNPSTVTETVLNIAELPYIESSEGIELAELVRDRILEAFRLNEIVVLDFAGQENVSCAFFLNAIGCLYKRHSEEYIRRHLRILNLSDSDRILMNIILKIAKCAYTKH